MLGMRKAFIWHLRGDRNERAMEKKVIIFDVPHSVRRVHEEFLKLGRKSGLKNMYNRVKGRLRK
jgi:hypothetical protein